MALSKLSSGINGFGRFGLHLLKYWLDRVDDSSFEIKAINDNALSKEHILSIIKDDYSVSFDDYNIDLIDSKLQITFPNGHKHKIIITNNHNEDISWVGTYDLFFECSGSNTQKEDCKKFLVDNTKFVLISATSWDADKTLIYGFNHNEYDFNKHKIISYGSCTVNAFVPLANFLNKQFGIISSDVNVIHNIPRYQLHDNYTLNRKVCTLEKSAIKLLSFVDKDNFNVNYTIVPYEHVSIIDFRFELKYDVCIKDFLKILTNSINTNELHGLYNISEIDNGPESFNCTPYSANFIKDSIRKIGKNIYIHAYFDNENSVNRYYDVANYLSSEYSTDKLKNKFL